MHVFHSLKNVNRFSNCEVGHVLFRVNGRLTSNNFRMITIFNATVYIIPVTDLRMLLLVLLYRHIYKERCLNTNHFCMWPYLKIVGQ